MILFQFNHMINCFNIYLQLGMSLLLIGECLLLGLCIVGTVANDNDYQRQYNVSSIYVLTLATVAAVAAGLYGVIRDNTGGLIVYMVLNVSDTNCIYSIYPYPYTRVRNETKGTLCTRKSYTFF